MTPETWTYPCSFLLLEISIFSFASRRWNSFCRSCNSLLVLSLSCNKKITNQTKVKIINNVYLILKVQTHYAFFFNKKRIIQRQLSKYFNEQSLAKYCMCTKNWNAPLPTEIFYLYAVSLILQSLFHFSLTVVLIVLSSCKRYTIISHILTLIYNNHKSKCFINHSAA